MIIDGLKEKVPEGSVVLSFDEKGKTPVKHYGGIRWQSSRKYYIPYSQKVKGIFDIFAARNVHSGERHWKFYLWKNSFIVIDFIEYLANDVYPDKDLYIILDGWRAHTSNVFNAYVDIHPRIHPIYLPTCSSWLNDIEKDFSNVQKDVLNNSNFSSKIEAVDAISLYFENILNSS